MRSRLSIATIVVGASAMAGLLWVAQIPSEGQGSSVGEFPSSYKAPRMADGKTNLNGIWQAFTTPIGKSRIMRHRRDRTKSSWGAYGAGPEGKASWKAMKSRTNVGPGEKKKEETCEPEERGREQRERWHELGDPELKCYMPGVRVPHTCGSTFQIVQGAGPEPYI